MKKICLILSLVFIFGTFTACKGTSPFSQPLTKWKAKGLELYVNEQGKGYILYKTKDETLVFDAEVLYGTYIYIYEHRENAQQPVELVREYCTQVLNNEEKCKIVSDMETKKYSHIFPDKIIFKKECDLTAEDIKYEFFEVKRDTSGEIIQPGEDKIEER